MTGAISASANSRAVRRASACSSVSSKSTGTRAPSGVPTGGEGADHHEDAVGGEEPRTRAAVAGEDRVDQLAGPADDLRRRRAGAHELLHREGEAEDAEREPPDHGAARSAALPRGGACARTDSPYTESRRVTTVAPGRGRRPS